MAAMAPGLLLAVEGRKGGTIFLRSSQVDTKSYQHSLCYVLFDQHSLCYDLLRLLDSGAVTR